MAFNAGLNTLCGTGQVAEAVAAGMLNEATLRTRVEQTLSSHFRLGAYDAPADVVWKNTGVYNLSRVSSPAHKALAREAAAKAVTPQSNPPLL